MIQYAYTGVRHTFNEYINDSRLYMASWDMEKKAQGWTHQNCGRGQFSLEAKGFEYVKAQFGGDGSGGEASKVKSIRMWEDTRALITELVKKGGLDDVVAAFKGAAKFSDPRLAHDIQVLGPYFKT